MSAAELPPIEIVQHWLERVVIGLSLCPFAAAPHRRGAIRFAVSGAGADPEATLAELWVELQLLGEDEATADSPQTTLLILPEGWTDFDDLLDLCAAGEALLEHSGLDEDFQIVAFHPDVCFEGSAPEDPGNLVNRSPVPLIHLLRTEDVAAAAEGHPDIDALPEQNAARLRALGTAAVRALWAGPGVGPSRS